MVKKSMKRPVVIQLKKTKKNKKMSTAAEPTALGKAMRALGGLGGGALGGMFGAPTLGGAAGSQLGALASKWLGFGDYAVDSNTVLTKASNGIPTMHQNSQSVVVRHKEYIGPIKSSTDFKVHYELPLNPGMLISFPWLSQVATRFQEYAFKGVVFHYVPTSGSAISGTSPSLGSVMMQTTYRASDRAPQSKLEMMNEYCASESVPSEAFIHPIECDPRENPFNVHYVRSTVPPDGEPLMSYDLGKTCIATQGQLAAGNIVGDLWVTYEVELKKPLVSSDVLSGGSYNATFTSITGWSNLFNTVDTEYPDGIKCEHAGGLLTIPKHSGKSFVVIIDFFESDLSVFTTIAPNITNGVFEKIWSGGPDTEGVATITSGHAQAIIYVFVTVDDMNQPTTMSFPFTATGTIGRALVNVAALDIQE